MVKGISVLLVISRMQVVLWARGPGFPGIHVQVLFLISLRILGMQRRGDGKDCAHLPPKEWGVRWACLAIFFLDLGWVRFALEMPGTCSRTQQAWGVSGWTVQPKGPVHWHWHWSVLIGCIVRAHGQTFGRYTPSAPPPNTHTHHRTTTTTTTTHTHTSSPPRPPPPLPTTTRRLTQECPFSVCAFLVEPQQEAITMPAR